MDGKTLLACITGSVEEERLLRNEYLVEENRILRQQIEGRVLLTDAQRRTLAEIGKKLSQQALEEVATIVNCTVRWRFQSKCIMRFRLASRKAITDLTPLIKGE